jgi:adenine phosphoribosyltransferase
VIPLSNTKIATAADELKKMIREIPDYPKPGILFYDITTLIKNRAGFARVVDSMTAPYLDKNVDLVLGMEARGFIFGPAMAYRLNAGFIPVRKPKKLPGEIVSYTYDLEYGTDTLEIHKDAIQPGQRVLIVDDLLATGGTAEATAKLAATLGADICGLSFVVELDFLNGRRRLVPYDVFSLLHYDE